MFERRRAKDGTVGAAFWNSAALHGETKPCQVNIFAYFRMFLGLDLVVYFNCDIFSAVSSTVVS